MKKIFFITMIFFIGSALQAQINKQTMMINSNMHIDSVGNASCEITGKLSAEQWSSWNAMFGGGKAEMIKRNFERSSSAMYLYDFKYTPNEMDRTFNIQYKIKGIVEYLGNDKWKGSLGLKNVEPMKLGENAFSCVTSELIGAGKIMQNNMKVTFPSTTSNMEFGKDEFGVFTVKYKMPTESMTKVGNTKYTIAGYALIAIAVISFITLFIYSRKPKRIALA